MVFQMSKKVDPDGLKTKSSYREISIPDYVFEAILKERQVYEKSRNRRKREFQDLDYICCSLWKTKEQRISL